MKTKVQRGAPPDAGAPASDGWFKYALIAYAVVEFFAIAVVVYYKAAR